MTLGPRHPRSLYLPVGAAAASLFNFYTFIIFPSLAGTAALDAFARDNYLGGAYLFGIGSSIAPMTVFVLGVGGRGALFKYVWLCALGFIAIALAGLPLARIPWSYLCLGAAVSMQAAGFLLATLIHGGRLATAGALQVVQPLVFAGLVTAVPDASIPWAWLYLISALICLGGFALWAPIATVREKLASISNTVVAWPDILQRTLLCVSFPLFFQLELILTGTVSMVDLGLYTMVQKLYASVSISLFGSLGILLVTRSLAAPGAAPRVLTASGLWMAAGCAGAILAVGALVTYLGKGSTLTVATVGASALLGFLFTLSALASLAFTVIRPVAGLMVFGGALAGYVALFLVIRPVTIDGVLASAACFFVAYLVLATLIKPADR